MYQYNLNDLQLIEKMLFKHMPGDSLKEKKKKTHIQMNNYI